MKISKKSFERTILFLFLNNLCYDKDSNQLHQKEGEKYL
jgi:hypothetical protein